jgi:hypothetical protein
METKILVETSKILKVQFEKIPEDGNKIFSRNIGIIKNSIRKNS